MDLEIAEAYVQDCDKMYKLVLNTREVVDLLKMSKEFTEESFRSYIECSRLIRASKRKNVP